MKSKTSLTVPKKPECPPNIIVKDGAVYKQAARDAEDLFEEVDRGGLPSLDIMWLVTGLLLICLLSGCGATPVAATDFTPTPVTFTVKVPYQCGQPPGVSAVKMRDIKWEVIEVEGVLFYEGAEPFTGELVTLTVDDYKLLGMNTSDWIAASRELKEQRNFYRDCIERSQKTIEEENNG